MARKKFSRLIAALEKKRYKMAIESSNEIELYARDGEKYFLYPRGIIVQAPNTNPDLSPVRTVYTIENFVEEYVKTPEIATSIAKQLIKNSKSWA
jgi:hypothetical protein